MNELSGKSSFKPDRPAGGPVSSDRMATEIDALNGLDLEALRERWHKLYRHPAPRFFRRELLIRGIAYQMQVKAYGGLSPKTRKRLLKLAAQYEAGTGFTTADAPRRLRPGTRLVRAWKGVTHNVNVLADGFEWHGRKYRSLSAIAREISGTNWNGFNFFGLDRRKGNDNG